MFGFAVSLEVLQKTLLEATEILCKNLQPRDVLRQLKSKGALNADDVERIKRSQFTTTDEVDMLLDMLRKKPLSSYNIFKEERQDLYQTVKDVERKNDKYCKSITITRFLKPVHQTL